MPEVLINPLAMQVVNVDTGDIVIYAPSIEDAFLLVGKSEMYAIEVLIQWPGSYDVFDPILNRWVEFVVTNPGWQRI